MFTNKNFQAFKEERLSEPIILDILSNETHFFSFKMFNLDYKGAIKIEKKFFLAFQIIAFELGAAIFPITTKILVVDS